MTSKIEWLARPGTIPESWNFIGGCSPLSESCYNCWAARMAGTRLRYHPRYAELTERRADGSYKWTGEVRLDQKELKKPYHWKKPRTIFVASMSDLCHEEIPSVFVKRDVWNVMVDCPQHTFLILTKRADRALELLGNHTPWPQNIWMGITAENQKAADERIPILLQIPAAVRFVSCEPLLGPVDLRWYLGTGELLSQHYLDWVIVGGETGLGARPMHPQWARDIRNQCQAAGVPWFFKQWGAWLPFDQREAGQLRGSVSRQYCAYAWRVGKKAAGHLLDGEEWHQWPE